MLLTTAITDVSLQTERDLDPAFNLHVARESISLSMDEMARQLLTDGKHAVASRLFIAAAHLCIAADKILGGKDVRSR